MATKTMTAKLLMDTRLDTAWQAISTVILPKGFFAVSLFTGSKALLKIGDGVSTWAQLSYLNAAEPIDLSDYYTKEETDEAISTAIAGLGTVFALKGRVDTTADLPSTGNNVGDVYLVGLTTASEFEEYYWTGTFWDYMGKTGTVDLSNYYTKSETDTLLSGKVDVVEGKGLSTNDFTTAEKTKLAGLENYDDTALSGRVSAIEADYLTSTDALVLTSSLDA